MFQTLRCWLVLAVTLVAIAPAQEATREQFRSEFSKGLELADDKLMDKAVKRSPGHAPLYYEELYWEKDAGQAGAGAKCAALNASWKRCFDNSETLDHLDRWCSGATNQVRDQLQKARTNSYKLWAHYNDVVAKGTLKADYQQSMQQLMELARNVESIGHNLEIADTWVLASVVASKIPEKTLADRRDAVFATEQFVEARKRWGFTFDQHYIRSAEWLKNEKLKLDADEKAGEKRKDEGYAADAKGVETLVMANAVEAKHPLKFEALPGWEELDYGPKGGPVPPFWWLASTAAVGTHRELNWFHARKLFLVRQGAAKWALVPEDVGNTKDAVEIDASTKGKPSTFWLDADKKRPYAMVFWTGSEREMVNEAECNLAPGDNVGNVYYRSAASWKTTVGADQITLYDDSADGVPGDGNPWDQEFHTPMLGQHDTEKGTVIPLLDSMRVGKGPRQPFSEFVKLTTGWMHLRKNAGDEIGVRPLNPEYVKPGKIKLVWNGPKQIAPVQLVIQGENDYRTAFFDVAGGKEIEVPAADYRVIWGRVMNGKGARAQIATLFQGDSKPFTVEAGKVHELKMGAPFKLTFARSGDDTATIDALKILLHDASGCVFTDLHNLNLACEVMAAKETDGKGAKVVGKFVRFTDPELVNKAAEKHNRVMQLAACFPMPEGYKSGDLSLAVKLPSPGMKLQLYIKKHPVFGEVKSDWQ